VVAVARTSVIASSKSLNVIATQKNLTANLSTNAGIFPESGKVQPGAQATFSLSKFMFDYGQTDRQLKLAALETQASILSAHAALNSELTNLLSNFIVLEGARSSLDVIDTYLSQYKEREQTIRTAVSSGILSRTDLLEIEEAKNNIDSQYERLKLTRSRSEKFLQTYLGERYSKVNGEISTRLVPEYELNYTQTNLSSDLIAVRKIALETEIEIAQNFDRYRINANASLSSPSPTNDSFSTFAGFSVTKPILDGGQSPATIDKKKADLEVLIQEIRALEFERELVLSSWEIYKKYHQIDADFLEERKEIIVNKSIELENRFKAGQVGVVSLASAILSSAQAEVDIIQHQTELRQKKLEAASALTQPCAVVDICEDIQEIFSTE
jgi:outer membrane protein TolC